MKTLNSKEVFESLSLPAPSWVGVAGYDDSPFFADENENFVAALPHSYREEYAQNGREPVEVTVLAEETIAALEAAPIGALLIQPDYEGCRLDGQRWFRKTSQGWLAGYDAEER